jgi:hypothetical protein
MSRNRAGVDRGHFTQEGIARSRRTAVETPTLALCDGATRKVVPQSAVRSRAVDLKSRAEIPRVIEIYQRFVLRQCLAEAEWVGLRDSTAVVWIAEVS